MNHFTRNLTLCACLVALSACEDNSSGQTSKSLLDNPAARGNSAEQVFIAMRDLCLRKPITFVDAAKVARREKLGLGVYIKGWDDFNFYGKPRLVIHTDQPGLWDKSTAPSVPKGTVFKRYSCDAQIRGTWADEVAVELAKELTANGFQTVQPLKRSTGKSRVGTDTVEYFGMYRRDGVNFKVSISDAGGVTHRSTAKATVTHYVSGTRIEIDGR